MATTTYAKKWLTGVRLAVVYVLLLALALFMMGPFLWLLSVSLMPGKNVFANPPAILRRLSISITT
ncbi:hypothetical protein CM49_03058 [Paenibacillus sp. P1XP2]|nr:hypothetical protein CM49_03058 [Paenibacillus sp. P1XP2]